MARLDLKHNIARNYEDLLNFYPTRCLLRTNISSNTSYDSENNAFKSESFVAYLFKRATEQETRDDTGEIRKFTSLSNNIITKKAIKEGNIIIIDNINYLAVTVEQIDSFYRVQLKNAL